LKTVWRAAWRHYGRRMDKSLYLTSRRQTSYCFRTWSLLPVAALRRQALASGHQKLHARTDSIPNPGTNNKPTNLRIREGDAPWSKVLPASHLFLNSTSLVHRLFFCIMSSALRFAQKLLRRAPSPPRQNLERLAGPHVLNSLLKYEEEKLK